MLARILPAFRFRRDRLPPRLAVLPKLSIFCQTAGVAGLFSRTGLNSLPRKSPRKNDSDTTIDAPACGGICPKKFPTRTDPLDPPSSSTIGLLRPFRRTSCRPTESTVEAPEHRHPTLSCQSQALQDGGLILGDRLPFVAVPLASAPFEHLQVRRQRHFETPLVRSPGRA